jgi:hypothetical protein
MTIAKTTSRAQYTGDGSTVAFSFPYRFFADTDLEVYLTVSGVETLQTLTTHYTVSNAGDETGGTVTFLTAPASGATVTILRVLPLTQSVDYQANDPFPPETHEQALDRLTLQGQQLSERQGRALIAPASDTASLELPLDRASKFLYFDASKNPVAAAGVSDVAVSAFMATPVAATGAEDFQQKVGIDEGIFFAPRTGVTYDEGLLYYDDDRKALTFFNDETEVALNIGQEVWAHVRNATGSTITNGQVVYINGATGDKPTIALADADTEATSRLIGLATHNIENNSNGFVTIAGEVGGLNTSAFSEGDLLYLSSTAGGLTTTKPGDGKHNRVVGVVARAHATQGSIFVHAMCEGLTLSQAVWNTGTSTDEALISPAKLKQAAALDVETALTTSGASAYGFTGIPAGARRITVMLSGVSLSGTDDILIQLGDSGGYENTGYSATSVLQDGSGNNAQSSTAGYPINSLGATTVVSGAVVLTRITGNTWVAFGTLANPPGDDTITVGGTKTLSAELDRVQVTVTGSDTFDAGTVNIAVEM